MYFLHTGRNICMKIFLLSTYSIYLFTCPRRVATVPLPIQTHHLSRLWVSPYPLLLAIPLLPHFCSHPLNLHLISPPGSEPPFPLLCTLFILSHFPPHPSSRSRVPPYFLPTSVCCLVLSVILLFSQYHA